MLLCVVDVYCAAALPGCPLTGSLLAEWLPVRWRGVLVVSLHAVWNAGRLGLTLWWVLYPPPAGALRFVTCSLPYMLHP